MNLAIVEQDAHDRARDAVEAAKAERECVAEYHPDAWTVAVVKFSPAMRRYITEFYKRDDLEDPETEAKPLFPWPYAIDSDEMASDLLEVYAAGEDAK